MKSNLIIAKYENADNVKHLPTGPAIGNSDEYCCFYTSNWPENLHCKCRHNPDTFSNSHNKKEGYGSNNLFTYDQEICVSITNTPLMFLVNSRNTSSPLKQ